MNHYQPSLTIIKPPYPHDYGDHPAIGVPPLLEVPVNRQDLAEGKLTWRQQLLLILEESLVGVVHGLIVPFKRLKGVPQTRWMVKGNAI